MRMPVYAIQAIPTAKDEWDVTVVMGDERTFALHTKDAVLIQTAFECKDSDIKAVACLHLAFTVIQESIKSKYLISQQ